jgi:hypothetical protein
MELKIFKKLIVYIVMIEQRVSIYSAPNYGPLRPPCPLLVTKFMPKETKYSISDFFVQASIRQ